MFVAPDVNWCCKWKGSIAWFYCDACRKAKHDSEGWTPGVYINEDGNVSTDSDDEYFKESCDRD
jgi:hypothetical protein